MTTTKRWRAAVVVVSIVVAALWLVPVSAKVSSTGAVLECDSLVTSWPNGVYPLPAFGVADDVVDRVIGGEDLPELRTEAAMGVARACDVERQNRQTSLFLALGVGAIVLLSMRRGTASSVVESAPQTSA